MSNVLNEEKRQQVIALGRLGWSLRRIERAAQIRRETIGAYLRAAGIAVRRPGGWGRTAPKPAINEVITDPTPAKPANEVITDFGAESSALGWEPSHSHSPDNDRSQRTRSDQLLRGAHESFGGF